MISRVERESRLSFMGGFEVNLRSSGKAISSFPGPEAGYVSCSFSRHYGLRALLAW